MTIEYLAYLISLEASYQSDVAEGCYLARIDWFQHVGRFIR